MTPPLLKLCPLRKRFSASVESANSPEGAEAVNTSTSAENSTGISSTHRTRSPVRPLPLNRMMAAHKKQTAQA